MCSTNELRLLYGGERRGREEHVQCATRFDELLLKTQFCGHLFAQAEEEGIYEW